MSCSVLSRRQTVATIDRFSRRQCWWLIALIDRISIGTRRLVRSIAAIGGIGAVVVRCNRLATATIDIGVISLHEHQLVATIGRINFGV